MIRPEGRVETDAGSGLRWLAGRPKEPYEPRRPGQFLEEQIQRKAMIAGVCIAFAWGLAALGLEWWPVALAVIPVVFVVDRQGRNGGRLDASRQLVGLEGERRAGAALEGLAASGVLAVHDLNVGRGNVDHVAISAQGVFAIEVKHLSGGRFHLRRGVGLMQGSRPADGHAAQARRNATAVHDLLLRSGIDCGCSRCCCRRRPRSGGAGSGSVRCTSWRPRPCRTR